MAHAKPLLLVNHKQPQILVNDVCRQKPVRADNNVHQPLFQSLDGLFHLARRPEARHHLNAHRKILHALHKRIVMLLRQNSGRHEICDLFAVLNRLERGTYGNLRLAIAHIAANQAVHDARTLHVAFCRLDGKQLVSRLLKRKHLLKLLLPYRVPAKDKSLLLLADGIQLHKIPCHLVDGSLYP